MSLPSDATAVARAEDSNCERPVGPSTPIRERADCGSFGLKSGLFVKPWNAACVCVVEIRMSASSLASWLMKHRAVTVKGPWLSITRVSSSPSENRGMSRIVPFSRKKLESCPSRVSVSPALGAYAALPAVVALAAVSAVVAVSARLALSAWPTFSANPARVAYDASARKAGAELRADALEALSSSLPSRDRVTAPEAMFSLRTAPFCSWSEPMLRLGRCVTP